MGRLEGSTGNDGVVSAGETDAIALELGTPLGIVTMKRPGVASTSGSQVFEEYFHRGALRANGARSGTPWLRARPSSGRPFPPNANGSVVCTVIPSVVDRGHIERQVCRIHAECGHESR